MNPFTELKVFAQLQPILNRLQKLMTMKLTTSNLCQILLCIMQILNVCLPLLEGNAKLWAVASIGIVQILVNTIAHNSNPDGTPATTAYLPKS